MGVGEAVEFDTRVPHGYAYAGNKALELLVIFGRDREQVHVLGGKATDRHQDPAAQPPS